MSLPYRANDIEIRECLLLNYRGNFIDIRDIMLEFSMFHDLMDTNGIHCEIVFADANGIVEMMPIVGDETIVITFRTPSFQDFRKYFFRVYKVGERKKIEQRADAYVIYGAAQETINNHRNSVNKSFSGLNGSGIITNIYENQLIARAADHRSVKIKTLTVEETNNNINLVFPGEKPYTAINQVSRESQSKSRPNLTTINYDIEGNRTSVEEPIEIDVPTLSSNFVFYEDYNGWNFRTIDGLMNREYPDPDNEDSTRDYIEDFYLVDASGEDKPKDGPKINDSQKISKVEFVKQFDSLQNLADGFYYHKVETIDPILKTFTTENFNYKNDYKDINHLEKKPSHLGTNGKQHMFSANSIFGSDTGTSKSHYVISDTGGSYDTLSITTDNQLKNPRKIQDFIKYDWVSRLQLNNIVLSVTIPGNTNIDVGQTIQLHLPQTTQMPDYMTKLNLLYGKKFFVTALRHTLNKEENTFFTVIECIKDTYARAVIEETTETIEDE